MSIRETFLTVEIVGVSGEESCLFLVDQVIRILGAIA